MNAKVITCNVSTFVDGEKIDYLSVDNCPPQLLNSILSLCKTGYQVQIDFVELDPDGMRSETSD